MVDQACFCLPSDLAQKLEQHISSRTWGRIHQLQVAVVNGEARIHGYTVSYFAKQLAIQAALEVLGSESNVPVKVDIRVGLDHAGQKSFLIAE
jgi:hypothetical protein